MFMLKFAKMLCSPSGILRVAPYLLIVPIIVFQTLSLTGCVSTSPAVPHIYIVSLRSNNNATKIPPQVRIGYYGLCGVDETGTRCEPTTGRSAETLAADLFPDVPGLNGTGSTKATASLTARKNPENITKLVTTALALQSHTFTSILAGSAVLFVLGLGALFVFKRDVATGAGWSRPRRSTVVRRATYGMLFGSAALALAAALATDEAARALQATTTSSSPSSPVLFHAGTTLQVLQWITFGFEALFALAVPFLVGPAAPAGEEYKGQA